MEKIRCITSTAERTKYPYGTELFAENLHQTCHKLAANKRFAGTQKILLTDFCR